MTRRLLFVLVAGALLAATACSDATSAPSYPPATVRGKVVTLSGLPAPGVLVSVAGRPAVTTDADGAFAFEDVPRPFTAIVGEPQWQRGLAFVGLTRTDPELPLVSGAGGTERTGSVCGTVAGADVAAQTLWTVLETPWGTFGQGHVDPYAGSYCTGAAWNGPASFAGKVHVLAQDYAIVGPGLSWVSTGFPGAGETAATLTSQQTTESADLALSPVASTSLRVHAALPPAWAADVYVDGFFGPAHGEGLPLGTMMTMTQPWPAVAIPALSGLRTHVLVWASGPEGGTHVHRILDGPTADLSVSAPLPPAPAAPADGATGVGPGTLFSWVPMLGGDVSWVGLSCGTVSYVVLTGGAAVALPDFGAVGLPCAAASAGSWGLFSSTGTGGVDGLTAAGSARLVEIDARRVSRDTEIGFSSVSRAFTSR